MNFELFISRRLSESKINEQYYSGPITKICIASISICVIIMIATISIGLGIQKNTTTKIINAVSDIKIEPKYPKQLNSTICLDNTTLEKLNNLKEIQTEPISEIKAIINTNNNTEYILLKGVQEKTYKSKLINYIDSGNYFSTEINKEIIISSYLKNKLGLNIGEKCIIHYHNGQKNTKSPFTIVGSYKMDLTDYFDAIYVFAKKEQIQKTNYIMTMNCPYCNNLKAYGNQCQKCKKTFIKSDLEKKKLDNKYTKWYDICTPDGLVSYYEINTNNNHTINQKIKNLILNNEYNIFAQSAKERIPKIFEWLDILNNNVFFILIIMFIICIINMTNVLLILILERLKMIGVLKSFGCSNLSIIKIFTHTIWRITKKSLIIGNLIGLSLCLIQKTTKIISLNPEIYFSNHIPVDFNIKYIIIINIITFIIIHISLIVPYYIIKKITPSNILKIT